MPKVDYEQCGVDNVMQWYDTRNGHYFTLHKGSIKLETGELQDREECRNLLYNRLCAMEREGSDVTHCLKIYPKKNKSGIDEKQYQSALYFVVCKPASYVQQNQYGAYNPDLTSILNKIQQQEAEMQQYKAKIAALEMELNAEEEEEEESGLAGTISGMLKQPEIRNALIGALVNSFAPKKPIAMAGNINTNIKEEALEILAANGVSDEDLMLLANLSINNPTQFKWLLSMLRNQ